MAWVAFWFSSENRRFASSVVASAHSFQPVVEYSSQSSNQASGTVPRGSAVGRVRTGCQYAHRRSPSKTVRIWSLSGSRWERSGQTTDVRRPIITIVRGHRKSLIAAVMEVLSASRIGRPLR